MHLTTIELKDMRVDLIDGGGLWMDAGTIFGVVPKPLWSRLVLCDAQNRIRISCMSLLVRPGGLCVLVEAGSAAHQPPKVREALSAETPRLVETLASLGVAPADVDCFIPTHLHFDHVGGSSTADAKRPLFPNARYVIQKAEWEEARNPRPVNSKAYLPGDIEPLSGARLEIVDGDAIVAPGVEVLFTGGHSAGHQMVRIGSGGADTLVFAGDIIPTSEHVSPRWMCAFDLFPVETYDAKVALLESAAREGWLVAAGHGGSAPLFTVAETGPGRFAAEPAGGISAAE